MSKSLAPINDINLKIFDEICEERFKNIDLECILISIIDNVPADALPHLAEQYHITGNEGWLQCRNDEEKRDFWFRQLQDLNASRYFNNIKNIKSNFNKA